MVNDNIKIIRRFVGISQRELGRRIKMSGQYIAKIEKSERNPTLETLNKIADALEVDISEILQRPKLINEKLLDELLKRSISIELLSEETSLSIKDIKIALTELDSNIIYSDIFIKIGTFLGFSKGYLQKYESVSFYARGFIIKSESEFIQTKNNLNSKFIQWVSKNINLTFHNDLSDIDNDITSKSLLTNEIKSETIETDTLLEEHRASYNIEPIPLKESSRKEFDSFPIEQLKKLFPNSNHVFSDDKNYFAVYLTSDSMNTLFPKGSQIVVEKCNEFIDGKITVVLRDTSVSVRKIIKNDNIITLIPLSTNPEHTPEIYDLTKDKIKALGIVKASLNFY